MARPAMAGLPCHGGRGGFLVLLVLVACAVRPFPARAGGVVRVIGPDGSSVALDATALAVVAPATVGDYRGPTLWALLDKVGVLAGGGVRDKVHQIVVVSGIDGFTAVLAMAEIAPAFENKGVILATSKAGAALPGGRLRLVVPGDAARGRSVRDVDRIAVETVAAPP